MSRDALSGPDLAGVVADANAVGLEHVVIGGFSVIYHGYIRATKDSDLLVSDDPDTDAAILRFLDRADATRLSDGKKLAIDDVADRHHLRVNTRHGIVDKRLADRGQDRADLEELETIHGDLPIEPIPGLDS